MGLYRVLGISASASPGEIERAYRRLARRFHPGINPGDRAAAEAFCRIQDAHAILSDVGRRREYDHGGLNLPHASAEGTVEFQGFDFSAPVEGPSAATFAELFSDVFQDAARRATSPDPRGELHVSLPLSFVDATRGGHFPVPVVRRERCAGCGGSGETPRPPVVCPTCGGEGTRRWARGHMVFAKPCEACAGDGQLKRHVCRTCGGAGVRPVQDVVIVSIPPGIEPGARVAVPGRGHADGAGGPPGDLYVVIEIASHPFFRREGRDVCLTLPVAIHEAALGARVDVPTLDGSVKLRIPPGTASGQRLRVSGRGVPSAHGGPGGDLMVEVQIVLPPVRDERSKELLREFGRLNEVDVRSHLKADGGGAAAERPSSPDGHHAS